MTLKIEKTIYFTGVFRKASQHDNEPIEIKELEIAFYTSGQVLIHSSKDLSERIEYKKQFERSHLSPSIGTLNIYRGCYEISGKTSDELSLKAIVNDDTSFLPEYLLREVQIKKSGFEHFEEEHSIRRAVYGLISRRAFIQPYSSFPSAGVSIFIRSKKVDKKDSILALSAELSIEIDEELNAGKVEFDKCLGIVLILLSFSRGDHIAHIYKTEYADGDLFLGEYWQGKTRGREKKIGLAPIQDAHQHGFVREVLSKFTFYKIEESGFFPAMYWYIESISSNVIATQVALLLICLESFVSRFSKNALQREGRLIERTLFKKIRKEISKLLAQERDYLASSQMVNEEDLENYDIFCRKLEKRIGGGESGAINTSPPLSNQLESLLEFYDVEHKDLFPKTSEIPSIRREIVHKGNYEDHNKLLVFKYRLNNLIIRLVLRILEYEGNYIEHGDSGELMYKTLAK